MVRGKEQGWSKPGEWSNKTEKVIKKHSDLFIISQVNIFLFHSFTLRLFVLKRHSLMRAEIWAIQMLCKVKPVEPAGNSTSLCVTAGDTEEMLSSGDTTVATAAASIYNLVVWSHQLFPLKRGWLVICWLAENNSDGYRGGFQVRSTKVQALNSQ